MSEQNISQITQQPNEPDSTGGAGFESEATAREAVGKLSAQSKPRKSDEMKRNFLAVFGHGAGKFALIAVVVVVLMGLALGYRGLTAKKVEVENTSKMDMPNAPAPEVEVGPVSNREAARRAEVGSREAEKAAAQGKTYQPGFDPNIVAGNQYQTGQNAPAQSTAGQQQAVPITVAAGQATASPTGSATNPQQHQLQAEQQAAARREQEFQAAKTERDKYVNTMREQVLKQVTGLFGDGQQQAQVNAVGTYSAVSYYPVNAGNSANGQGNVAVKAGVTPLTPEKEKTADGLSIGDSKGKMLIKTGSMMYATLDSEINTDDGGEALATVRGGKWDGAKLIGKVEQSPNNIRAIFSILAPQDNRHTMRIKAVALREQDAKQGVAEAIDHHTLSRYTSLGVASLLSGYGKAYAIPAGTAIVSNGTVVTTTEDPSNKRVVGSVVGEMGTAIAGEIRSGFNRPTTYSTPAQHGFGLFFLQDVYDQSN